MQVVAERTDMQPWQGHSKRKPEQTQSEMQGEGSLPAIDSSQVGLPDQGKHHRAIIYPAGSLLT